LNAGPEACFETPATNYQPAPHIPKKSEGLVFGIFTSASSFWQHCILLSYLMEAAATSETSVQLHQITHHTTEDSSIHRQWH
jgi:hypothetical protein